MSQVVAHKTKKRKHAPAEGGIAEPSTKRSKTTKTKKDKEGGKVKEGKKKDKGKTTAGSQFKVVKATLALSIPPVFAMKPREGAEEMLDSMVMRCASILITDNVHFDNVLVRPLKIHSCSAGGDARA